MSSFSIWVEKKPGSSLAVFYISGYFDDEGGKKFQGEVQKALAEGGRAFLFCLKSVPMVNSSGMSALLNAIETISLQHHGRVAFSAPSRPVLEAFTLVGIKREFPIYENHETAMKDFPEAAAT